MEVQSPDTAGKDMRGGIADILAVGFGTTVAMWAVGYVAFLPLARVPKEVFLALMLACLVAGGWVLGRYARRGTLAAVWVGLISATLNLLILGSLLWQPPGAQTMPSPWLWLPAVFVMSAILAAAGSLAGRVMPLADDARPPDWLACLAWVTCAAALLLITVGGLVTGFRAGMAVPDWPGSFGYNMFLFPLAMMTGGVFYEHAHRLIGTLLGLSVLTMAIYVTAAVAVKRTLLACIWLIGVCVAIQGVLGGLRVTEDSYLLAVVHGSFAHLVLGALVVIAVVLSRAWQSGPAVDSCRAVAADRLLSACAVGLILLQTLLGVVLRQLNLAFLTHVSLAAVVILAAVGLGMRAWGLHPQSTGLRRGGAALMLIVVVQLLLGITAAAFRTPSIDQSPDAAALAAQGGALPVAALPALITTAHQANAALMLWLAAALAAWMFRPQRREVRALA